MCYYQPLHNKLQLWERTESKNPNPLLHEVIFILIKLHESLKLCLKPYSLAMFPGHRFFLKSYASYMLGLIAIKQQI